MAYNAQVSREKIFSMTQTWFQLSLGDGLFADLPIGEIEQRYRDLYTSIGCPEDLAVFKRHELGHGLHCEVTAYFSPAASALAQHFAASPCRPPPRSGLELLAGNPVCWALLFDPDH